MTVSSATYRNSFNGNGTTDTFAYTFRILSNAHISVYVDGVLKTLTTHYTITGVGASGGGNIVFVTPPPTGTANVVAIRNMTLTQETDYVENDPFPAATHEEALDKLTMIVQEINERVDRTVHLVPSSTYADLEIDDPVSGRYLRWKTDLSGIESVSISGAGLGDALTTNPLSQFAATTSAQLAGVISDETGSGSLVFANTPTLIAPLLGTPTSGTLTNCAGLPASGVSGTALVSAAIGTTVQAYDADLTTWAGVTPGTGVATALSVNIGSAGAPVVNGGALGTPSSGTLTNCTGLPVNGIVDDTTSALGVGSIELGHASDTTLSRVSAGVLAVEGVTIPSISSTNILTNKRINPRVGSTTSSATPTINTDNYDIYQLTAQAVDITSFTTNLSGTPVEGQVLIIEITGTAARAITWGASFENGITLPSTTVGTAKLTNGFLWNAVTSKWRCVASV